jgi:diguanylate cyclase (GGDEF)-like protein/PAS domain S-box-containing protein
VVIVNELACASPFSNGRLKPTRASAVTGRAMQSPKNRRILIVDDNRAIHQDFRKILCASDAEPASLADLEMEIFGEAHKPAAPRAFDLSSAYQGQEALAMVVAALERGEPYAMAFVDMRMPPGWDGVETISKLWEVDPDLQVIICTAYSDYSWEEILERFGMNDRLLLLKKPFDTAEVCQLACALTEKWHLARHAHLKVTQLRAMVEEQTRHLEQANLRLKESETRYALAAAGANDGLWDWNLIDDQIFYSPRWKEMIGCADGEIGHHPEDWLGRIHPEDRAGVEQAFEAHKRGVGAQLCIEYRVAHTDGQYRWMLARGLVVADEGGRPCRAAGSQTDITDRKMAEAQLRHDALHDRLTGLPNRAVLSSRIDRCLVRMRRQPAFRFAVMFIDLDRFKVINDSLGHLVGDALLVALAKRLSSCVREADTLSLSERNDLVRIGGDEFVLLLEGIRDSADAFRVAERLLEKVAEPIVIEGNEVHATLSIGIAIGHAGYQRVEDVLRDADTALYRAKTDGRARYQVFSEELHTSAMVRWQTENDLRRAIDRRELFLQYQPVISLTSGEIAHVEALVRWRHPTRGLVSPADFIPLAEETGLIVPLGDFVLREACRQIRDWRERLPAYRAPSVAINVSSKQFARSSFVDEVKGILRATSTAPSALKLEITEGATMEACAVDTCARLSELGIEMHLDDFGTGYSSLSYLHRMRIHALKIDRSFVATIGENPTNASIVQTILSLSRALGIHAIAEGIETHAQLELLRRLDCHSAQGYYWAKPLDPERAFALLESQPFRARVGHERSIEPPMLAPPSHRFPEYPQ